MAWNHLYNHYLQTTCKLSFAPKWSHPECLPLAAVPLENNLENFIKWSLKCMSAPAKMMQLEYCKACEQQDKDSI